MDPIQQDAFKRELERKSLDTIMIHNPTEKDFFIEWDKRYHKVPNINSDVGFGKGNREIERYLAEKYERTMINHLINGKADKYMEDLQIRFEQKGTAFRDKYEFNNEALARVPKTNDQALIDEIRPQIILGLVREFGNDMPIPENTGTPMDERQAEEKLNAVMNKPYVPQGELPYSKAPDPVTFTSTAEPKKKAKFSVLEEVAA